MGQLPPGMHTQRKDTQGCRPPAQVLWLSTVPILPHSTQVAFILHSPVSLGKDISPGLSPEGQGRPFSTQMKPRRRMMVSEQPFLHTRFTPGHAWALWGSAWPRSGHFRPSLHTREAQVRGWEAPGSDTPPWCSRMGEHPGKEARMLSVTCMSPRGPRGGDGLRSAGLGGGTRPGEGAPVWAHPQ